MKKILIVCLSVFLAISAYSQTDNATADMGKERVESGTLKKAIIRYETGEIREVGYFRNGKKDGIWQSFNKTGKVVAEAHFNLGNKDGKWLIWDENGSLRYEMYYDKGDKVGHWKIFDTDGNLIEEKIY